MSSAPGLPFAPDQVTDDVPDNASIIDLRDDAWVSSMGTVPVTAEPTVDESASRLRRRRRLIVAVLVAFVALVVVDTVLGRVIHDQRQRHLAFDVTQSKTTVSPGEALMVLQIPQIGVNTVVTEGATSADLRGGPGHVGGSAYPNGTGNIVVVGHRTRYEGPFGDLSTVVKGSQIAVQMRSGLVRGYSVSEVRTVPASDRSAIEPSSAERLTLVTSGSGLLPDKLVVVTATPTSAVAGTPNGTPYQPDSGALDARPTNGLIGIVLVIVVLALMGAAIVSGGRELRRRYSPLTTFAALLPVVGLLVVVLMYAADSVTSFLY